MLVVFWDTDVMGEKVSRERIFLGKIDKIIKVYFEYGSFSGISSWKIFSF